MAAVEAVARVGDLVDVAPVRPVIRLRDLGDPALRATLASAFVLTEDAAHALRTVLKDVRQGRGRGYFLEGNFGAGKSHLMAVLQGLLAGSFPPAELGGELERGGDAAVGGDLPLPSVPPLPVAISLVEHAAAEPLAEVAFRHIVRAVGRAPAMAADASRRDRFDAALAAARHQGHAGLVLLLDELSEFLRAKPDARAFAEDARFLQFLGEWASAAPVWVLLGVQEAVEASADLPAEVCAGLRDRFGVRFRLGAGHVRQLISRRLVRHRPDAAGRIAALAADIQAVFGEVPGGPAEFAALYPVHPLTVELLDRLRPLFSQRRGVVDFIAARLAGDPARRIARWLDRPVMELLGPDAIVDHFRDRARERPESAPLVSRALEHFEHDLGRIFTDPAEAEAALRLGKILIAGALCPTPIGFTAGELTLALLRPLTRLDPALNVEFVAGLATRMAERGAYVGCVEEPAAIAGRPPVRRYHCDLRADIGPVLRQRLDRCQQRLEPGGSALAAALLPWCDEPCVPLQRLSGAQPRPWDVMWRRTPRQVAVWRAEADALTPERVREAARELESGEPDALVVLAGGPVAGVAALRRRWERDLAPLAAGVRPEAAILLWLPREPAGREWAQLRLLGAHSRLAGELETDSGETSLRLLRHLRSVEGENRRAVAALCRDLYLQGVVLDTRGGVALPADLGRLPFSALLERLLDLPLARRFPQHPDLPPGAGGVVQDAVEKAVAAIVRQGEYGADAEVAAVAGQLLAPLGLCSRDARGFRLNEGAAAGPHAAALAAAVAGATAAEPAALPAVYARLRKGPGGLGRPLFNAVCLTLCQSGAVSAVRGGRRLPRPPRTAAQLWAAAGLCPGELVAAPLRPILRQLPFVPPHRRDDPLTHALQREIWDRACAWSREWRDRLPGLRQQLARAREMPAVGRLLGRPDDAEALERLRPLLAAVHVSLPPYQGLARLLRAWAEDPAAGRRIESASHVARFLAERCDGHVAAAAYLGAPEFASADEDLCREAAALRQRLDDPNVALGEGWPAAMADFLRLRERYAAEYSAAHAAAHGPGPAAAPGDAALRLARSVADRLGPAVPPPLAAALRAAGPGPVRCTVSAGALAQRLRTVPGCVCGFRCALSGDGPASRDTALAAEAAEAALVALRAPAIAKRLRAADPTGAAAIVLSSPPDDRSGWARALAELERVPDEAWAAVRSSVPAVRRDLGALERALDDREWALADLLNVVRRWAGEGRVRPVRSLAAPPDRLRRWEESLAALQAATVRPPRGRAEWESLWLGPAGAWHRRLEEAADLLSERGGGGAPHAAATWRAAAATCAERLDAAFAADLPRQARRGLEPVGRVLDELAGGGGTVFAFCVDGLRADLVEAVLDECEVAAVRWRRRECGVAWAVAPTVTSTQFEAWAAAGWSVRIARQDEAAAAALAIGGRPALSRAAWTPDGRAVCKWDFLDRRLHTADDGFGLLAAEFRLRVRRLLLPALRSVGTGERVVLFADHGFAVRVPSGGPSRYTHGGDSPDEVLAPWCVLERL